MSEYNVTERRGPFAQLQHVKGWDANTALLHWPALSMIKAPTNVSDQTLLILKANPEHACFLSTPMARIWAKTQYNIPTHAEEFGDERTLRLFAKTMLFSFCDVWIGYQRKNIVGFMTVRDRHITQLHVAPHVQGQGIGAQFLEHAKQEYPSVLTLRCWHAFAGGFYEKSGFQPEGVTEVTGVGHKVNYIWTHTKHDLED